MLYKQWVKIRWILLEAKIKYYLFPLMDNLTDNEYDKLEQEDLAYCLLHNLEPIKNMVGVDQTKDSVKLVIDKILRVINV